MMKLCLAYNLVGSVSGENVFVENMKTAFEGRGFDISLFEVRQSAPNTMLTRLDLYSRIRLLAGSYRRLGELKNFDLVHFLNGGLIPLSRYIKGKKIGTTHFFLEDFLEACPNQNPLYASAENLYAKYVRALDKPGFQSLDCLVACSDHQARCVKECYGLDPSKVEMIHPGIDTAYLKALKKKDIRSEYGAQEIIVYTGRLHERSKGVSYLIKAMKILNRKGLKCLIIGEGPDRRNYERLVKEYGLADSVLFLGHMGYEEKSIFHKSADVLAMPSLYEVFGTVFAESLSLGVPIVAFDLPFWKGLYDGAGVFAKPRDESDLARCLAMALDDPALRKKLIAQGLESAERYDLKRTADSYISLYEELG